MTKPQAWGYPSVAGFHEPAWGSEADKIRPAVIVSDDGANESVERNGRGVVSVVPLTSNTTRVLSFQVLLRADVALRRHLAL